MIKLKTHKPIECIDKMPTNMMKPKYTCFKIYNVDNIKIIDWI